MVDGLPEGITSAFAGGVLTISGVPSVTLLTETEFTYTISTSGNSGGCTESSTTGIISVAPEQVITLVSSPSIADQDICDPTAAITDIVYDLSGSAITISETLAQTMGLPPGISANRTEVAQVNTINISGAATGTHRIAIDGEIFSFGDDKDVFDVIINTDNLEVNEITNLIKKVLA